MLSTNSPKKTELTDLLNSKPQQTFTDQATVHVHEFYLNGEILDADEYTEWFNKIRHASELDEIKIYINSEGGDLMTAVQFMSVIDDSSAHIIASIEGSCMSAATLIMLAADDVEISDHSLFMFHNYTSIAYGKGGELVDQILHQKKWAEALMRDYYSNFLSESEIELILTGKDIWLTGDEVIARLEQKYAKEAAPTT